MQTTSIFYDRLKLVETLKSSWHSLGSKNKQRRPSTVAVDMSGAMDLMGADGVENVGYPLVN